MSDVVRSLWLEPSVPDAPRRVWRDWALVGFLVAASVLEVILRNDLGAPVAALLLGVPPIFTLLWRRTHPLAMVSVAFAFHAAAELVGPSSSHHSLTLYATAYIVLLPYALLRWGSGRQAGIGLAIMFVAHLPMFRSLADVAGTIIFLLFPAALGAAMRYRASSKAREIDQVKLREREQLARELHDTVAHHVSAIIIQAQAGRTVAASTPSGAVDALAVIEGEASRALAEMRLMVGALRRGEDPDLSPQRGVADIEGLAEGAGDGLTVGVELRGELGNLAPSVDAAIFRLAQESITNAVRHSRHATRVDVSVAADDHAIRLTVTDDGETHAFGSGGAPGYGLVGMAERASLLGGTLESGPIPDRGWSVTAVLPRNGDRK